MKRVSVKIYCHTMYGVSETWTIASGVPKEMRTSEYYLCWQTAKLSMKYVIVIFSLVACWS